MAYKQHARLSAGLYTVNEVSKIAGVYQRTLWRWIAVGTIPPARHKYPPGNPSRKYYKTSEAHEVIDRLRQWVTWNNGNPLAGKYKWGRPTRNVRYGLVDLAELVRMSGVSIRDIRNWCESGLIPKPRHSYGSLPKKYYLPSEARQLVERIGKWKIWMESNPLQGAWTF